MVKMRIMDQLVPIGSPVPWTKKRGVILRKAGVVSNSDKARAARARFAAAAAGGKGQRGKRNGLPITAAIVKERLGGRGQ